MEYLSIKALSAKFAMPERTVYYNIANKKKIRRKKQWRTTLANFADFAKYCNLDVQDLQTVATSIPESKWIKDIANSQPLLAKLQNENQYLTDKTADLQKFNSNLQKQANEYALALQAEKNEKKEILDQNNTIQTELKQRMDVFAKKELEWARKYYLAIGLVMLLLLAFAMINLPDFLSQIE